MIIDSAAIILTPGVIKQYFPMLNCAFHSPIFQLVNCTHASLDPIIVGKSSIVILEPNNFINCGLKNAPPLPKCSNWGLK